MHFDTLRPLLFHVIFESIAATGRQRQANDLINDNHIFHYAQTHTQTNAHTTIDYWIADLYALNTQIGYYNAYYIILALCRVH